MEKSVFEKIFSELKSRTNESEDHILFDRLENKNTFSVKIDKSFFKSIDTSDEQNTKTIAFIDSGNADLLTSSNFSLQLIRLCCVMYKGTVCVKKIAQEFYVLIQTVKEEQEEEQQEKKQEDILVYKTTVFGSNFVFPNINSFDANLREGNHRVTPLQVVDKIRTLSELYFIQEVDCDYIVRDGDLDFLGKEENKLFQKICSSKTILGVSKTNTLFTYHGDNALASLQRIAPKNAWRYPLFFPKPTGENDLLKELNEKKQDIVSFVVKLHEKSEYVFRLDSNRFDEKIFSFLQMVSKDPIFLGYPYPLVVADRFARVSNQEKEMLKMKFLTFAGRDAEFLRPYLRSSDAHSVLDSVG